VAVEPGGQGADLCLGNAVDVVVEEHEPFPAEHLGDEQPQVAFRAEVARPTPTEGEEFLVRGRQERDALWRSSGMHGQVNGAYLDVRT
jgi:hypothetical protein